MSEAASTNQNEALWQQPHSPWLIALVVTMATFMEVLIHQRGQRGAATYRGESGSGSGREYLGVDVVSRLQRRGASAQRLAFGDGRSQAILHELRGALYD